MKNAHFLSKFKLLGEKKKNKNKKEAVLSKPLTRQEEWDEEVSEFQKT